MYILKVLNFSFKTYQQQVTLKQEVVGKLHELKLPHKYDTDVRKEFPLNWHRFYVIFLR